MFTFALCSVCILVRDVRKLRMKNKTTKERNWDNHIDLCVKICEEKDETQAISAFQCYRLCDGFTRALQWAAGMSEQSSPFTSPQHQSGGEQLLAASTPTCSNPPRALATKGCLRCLHGWVSQQSKQTDQKLISPPGISQH